MQKNNPAKQAEKSPPAKRQRTSTLQQILDEKDSSKSPSQQKARPNAKPVKRKRLQPVRWSQQDTQTFLRCLQMFGTDFSFICKFLPTKSRSQIVKKYKWQQRVHPQLISKSIAQNENRRITRHLKLRETSVIRMESVQSNKSLDSVDRKLCNQVKEIINEKDVMLTRSHSHRSQKKEGDA